MPVALEDLTAINTDQPVASLKALKNVDLFILLLGHRYGILPKGYKVSFAELEYNKAVDLGLPVLVFSMSADHPITTEMIGDDEVARQKFVSFKARASIARIRGKFRSAEELGGLVMHALCEIQTSPQKDVPICDLTNPIPKAPSLYAEPDYIASHNFVGRDVELQALTDWAQPADPTNLLLFESIGGNGKSMLAWEWVSNPKYGTAVRPDWAGRFWYSFYEKGAVMADFCQRALAYMTGQPLEEFCRKKNAELAKDLLAQLHSRPWLLVLDGVERVLVAYHRVVDAAEVPDEQANIATDRISSRNPCDAIRDEDNDLFRALANAAPSKVLVSSRLTPRVLLNPSGQPIPGAKRIALPGLRPPDAEALLRSCGIKGDSAAIKSYLTANCDNHPLTIGILGGLIGNYLPARGNFDAWLADSGGGPKLDLASLDLIQRRNHILRAAINTLPPASRRLLSTLALFPDSVDYETLKAFNPFLPREPEDVETAQVRLATLDVHDASKNLASVIHDLEQRGLLQYDSLTQHYNIHPVVRGVATGSIKPEDKERYGQHVVDHFSSLLPSSYEEAETLEDLRSGLNVVHTLLNLGRIQEAADALAHGFSSALISKVEAYAEAVSLLRAFFPTGWGAMPNGVEVSVAAYLANAAGNALSGLGEWKEALAAYGVALRHNLETENWANANAQLRNISGALGSQNQLAKALRVDAMTNDLAALRGEKQDLFKSRLLLFVHQSQLGRWEDAEGTWELLDPMGREWARGAYRSGEAECHYAEFQYWKGTMREAHLTTAERLVAKGKNRSFIHPLHGLRGAWRLVQSEWALAAASLAEAVRMSRDSGVLDAESETGLALAKHHLGKLAEPRREVARLAQMRDPAHRLLAQLWLALGEPMQAKFHALAAYKSAWADGEPYVNRYELTKTTELLEHMQIPIPNLAPYDPAKDEPFSWDSDVRIAIEKLRTENEAEEQGEGVAGIAAA